MAKAKWIGQLSTTEPYNHIGLVKVRQDNVNSETFEFQIVENNIPYDLTGLEVFFNTHFSRFSPVQQRAIVIDAKKGIIQYTMNGNDMQKAVALQPAYFEFRNKDVFVGSTQTFHYHIIGSVYQECTNGEAYIVKLEELFKLYQDFFNSQSQDWYDFLEINREILEDIDPGGKIITELTDARLAVDGTRYASVKERLDSEFGDLSTFRPWDKGVIKKVYEESRERAINVKWYGALGNGVTDDSNAIKQAIGSLLNKPGKIFFPPGIYNISEPITEVLNSVQFIGSGYSNGLGTGSTVINVKGAHNGFELKMNGSSIENLTVKGNLTSLDGIYLTGSRCYLRDIEIHGAGRSGIKVGDYGEIIGNANIFDLNHIIITGSKEYGLHISAVSGNLPDAGAGNVSNIDVRGSGKDGIFADRTLDTCFYNPVCQHNGGFNIRVGKGGRGVKFYGFYTEASDTGEFKIDAGAEQTMIFGQRHNQFKALVIDEGKHTYYLGYDNQNPEMLSLNKLQFDQLEISNPSTSGRWKIEQLEDRRRLKFSIVGTSDTNPPVEFPKILVGTSNYNHVINRLMKFSATISFISVPILSSQERDIPAPGVLIGDSVMASPKTSYADGLVFNAYIKTDGIITVRATNVTNGLLSTGNIVFIAGVIG